MNEPSLMNRILFVVGLLMVVLAISSCSGPSGVNAQENDNGSTGAIMSRHDYRIHTSPLPDKISFAGEFVPLNVFYVKESLERELLVNTYWHSSTLLSLKRARRWFPVIEPILKQNRIPDDFKYLCMIESNLTNVKSPAGASGFWQFMEGTAKEYKLELNADVDERYHVEKSTEAACTYLNKAYEKFGNWSLVAAAYNAGSKRIETFVQEQQAASYFDLLMAEETERYLYRILALKMIDANPSVYGFYPNDDNLYLPLIYTTITVNETITDLAGFARKHGLSYKLLKVFNPWLRSNKLPVAAGKSYQIKIPGEPFNRTHLIYSSLNDSIK